MSLNNTTAIIGARYADVGSVWDQGAAYVFRNLDTATGTVTHNVKLVSSDGAEFDSFGASVGIAGNIGLVGSPFSSGSRGATYVFRNLNTATGTITQNAKLTASDGATGDNFGDSVSISGIVGLIGAYSDDIGSNNNQGSAYVFRNLDAITGTVTENVKLTASDGATNDSFGISVALSGHIGLVGATGADIGSQSNQGAAYIFTNLYTATGNIVQNLKLVASDGAANDNFGRSVTLDGDRFVVGATGGDGAVPNSGKAYMGTVSSMTTLNLGGGGTRSIDGISFISQEDWIIGDSWDNNSVTLTAGDSANVTVSGKKVYVGRHASSDNNTLSIEGSLTANEILVGASGNTGNHLQVDGTVTVSSGLLIAGGSSLGGDGTITGDVTFDLGAKFVFQLDLPLTITGTVWMDSSFGIDDLIGLNNSVALGTYKIIEGTGTDFSLLGLENWGASNAYDLGAGKYAYFQQGSLEVVVVPEPSTWALLILSGLGLGLFRRRSLRAVER